MQALTVNAIDGFWLIGALPPPPYGFGRGVVDIDEVTDSATGVAPTLVTMITPKYHARPR